MNMQLNQVAKLISEKLVAIYRPEQLEGNVFPLAPIERMVTGYGNNFESVQTGMQVEGIGRFAFTQQAEYKFDEFHHRLYTSSVKAQTEADFITLSGRGNGSLSLQIISENEECSRVIRVIDLQLINEKFTLPPIATSELLSGDSLYLKVIPRTVASVQDLNWEAISRQTAKTRSLRVVLIRTYGNKNIVQENLDRLTDYLKLKKIHLDNYLFIVYDATGDQGTLNLDANLHLLYLHGGNYGGGGNASLLIAALRHAHTLCSDVEIEEVILWDDDAILEPQMFLRHNGFCAFRKPNVAHTGIVFAKTSPSQIQEYGAIWGSFFDLQTSQISLDRNKQRQTYPYLLRYNRDVKQEDDRKYIGTPQEIDFGTFIYISIPFALLEKSKGSIPFFLRNDDVELSLRLKEVGGQLVVNQNLFAWHEATHNVVGEFYATLHGMIVNAVYFDLDNAWLIKNLMEKVIGASSVGNTALLEAYLQAIKLFIEGPGWMNNPEVFKIYLAVAQRLAIHIKQYEQVPLEVVDVLKQKNGVEIFALTNSHVHKADANKKVVFYDAPNKRYLIPSKQENEAASAVLIEITKWIGQLPTVFESSKKVWTEFVHTFDATTYWDTFFKAGQDAVTLGKILPRTMTMSSLSISKTSLQTSTVSAVSVPAAGVTGSKGKSVALPADFNPKNYLKMNPDVEAAGVDPVKHYLIKGISEGRRYK